MPKVFKTSSPTRQQRPARIVIPVTLLALSMLTGCAAFKRDHVIVGAVPDDYRTNHPITVSEKNETYDIPVAPQAGGLLKAQRSGIQAFLERYDSNAGGEVRIIVPKGSVNEAAAERVAGDLIALMGKSGVPTHTIMTYGYQARVADSAPPVRVSYLRLAASTDQCGRWPDNLADHSDNKNWANFGCSYQNNLAAQIANPADLLGPRKTGAIDVERRTKVIGDYQSGEDTFDPETSIDF